MQKTPIKHLLEKEEHLNQTVHACGWIRSIRVQKTFFFMQINDGSTFDSIQIVAGNSLENYEELVEKLSTGASVQVQGTLVTSQGKGQSVEIHPKKIFLIGESEVC